MKNSSLFNEFGGTPTNNITSMLNQFNQFRSMFMGNPETQVKQMIQNGRMSQEQFNQFAQIANQLYPLIKK